MPTVISQIRDGKLRGILIASSNRSEFLPDLKTAAEQGYPDVIAVNWTGLLAPARTPPAIIKRLNDEATKALADPELKERLSKLGAVPFPMASDAFNAFIRTEMESAARIAKAANLKVDQ